MELLIKERKWKADAVIPENVDPVELADEIKEGMSAKFLKRLKALK